MAFPIPSHLPRKGATQDVSSQILSKVASTSAKSLNAEVAASWVAELDRTILETKTQIYDRIYADLPSFEEQFASSKAVQERLFTLTTNVNELDDAVSHPEVAKLRCIDSEQGPNTLGKLGIIPTLLRALSVHATLVRESQDAEVTYDAMEHLLRCRREFDTLTGLADDGKLSEAAEISTQLQSLLDAAPPALVGADVLSQLKSAFRSTRDRVEEQLIDAYSRSVVLSHHELIIRPSVQGERGSEASLPLSSILSSFSSASLSNHLGTLRRDISAHYIDHILTQPTSLSHSFAKDPSGMPQQTLTIFPSPPFLKTSFKKTLCKPITTALLQQFLYLELVKEAEEFEERYIIGMLGQDSRDRDVKAWTDGVSSHYERKRRAQILENVRQTILREDDGSQARVEVDPLDLPSPAPPSTIPAAQSSGSGSGSAGDVSDDAWGLEEEGSGDTDELVSAADEEDAWGFEDEATRPGPSKPPAPPQFSPPKKFAAESETAPPGDDSAWGWDDNDDGAEEESTPAPAAGSPPASSSGNSADWDDDPWGELSNPSPTPSAPPTSPPPQPSIAASAPKPASRLEKLANKGKAKAASPHTPQSGVGSPISIRPPPPTPVKPTEAARAKKVTVLVKDRAPPPVETYSVSKRAQELADTTDAVLREGAEFASSKIFDPRVTAAQPRGSVILQTAPMVLDLFRALYPVKFGHILVKPASAKSLIFANDCTYLRGRTASAARRSVEAAREKLDQAASALDALGRSWFERSVELQQDLVSEFLKKADGFSGTAEQDRYDECEEGVMGVVSQVRTAARVWKGVLNKTRYFDALGSLVNFSLGQILDDILALPDITEVESRRLGELCRILHALEGLFVEDPEQPSFVVACVPIWLKFSYLSELLEASLADISYLFDEGALIDYETQELVKLVRALFADTPQRANMVTKLTAGHSHSH
ncbi:hypothetical protein BC834DRAFT_921934 [Gloeopeniophorella convolvens]|nr:hypothetical protein BC834DRAFT_921934 [Gloeopeniophorella convolvens]